MTPQQRKALHKWFELYSEALNNAGYDMKTYFEQSEFEQPAPWTKYSVKETLFKRIAVAMFGIESTEDLEPKQFREVCEVFERNIAQGSGVHIPFPAEEDNA